MSSETPSLEECIAFMSFCVKDESTIVLREHMAEGRAIVGYLRDLAAARRDAQALRDHLAACITAIDSTAICGYRGVANHAREYLAKRDAALAADDAQDKSP